MSESVDRLLPARMVNEFVYCPRLFYLEHVQGEWADSADTEDGRHVHRRVDQPGGDARRPGGSGEDGADAARPVRSLLLSAAEEGLIARIDLLEPDGEAVMPVDYKRGEVPARVHDPERVQLGAQALILRANGYECERGALYFAASKRRIEVRIDDALVTRTRGAVADARALADQAIPPPPLVDDPRCDRCSLRGICLPDEHQSLATGDRARQRPLPAHDHALPVYVQTPGAKVGVRGQRLDVRKDNKQLASKRLIDVSQVCIVGNAQASSQATRILSERGIPLVHFTSGWQFRAITHGMPHRNVALRRAQFRAADDDTRALIVAREWIATKIANQRTQLRRNLVNPGRTLVDLQRLARKAQAAEHRDQLLGLEGAAARAYFGRLGDLLRPPGSGEAFDFTGRNRRPPRDPINAMLSLGYALLAKDWTATLLSVGFDPFLGLLHQPHHGQPALALDMMEPFRPVIVDSIVVTLVNTGEIAARHAIQRGPAAALTATGRRRFIQAYERRLATEITHPEFRYKVSYRRLFEVQARMLGRYLTGEIDRIVGFRTR